MQRKRQFIKRRRNGTQRKRRLVRRQRNGRQPKRRPVKRQKNGAKRKRRLIKRQRELVAAKAAARQKAKEQVAAEAAARQKAKEQVAAEATAHQKAEERDAAKATAHQKAREQVAAEAAALQKAKELVTAEAAARQQAKKNSHRKRGYMELGRGLVVLLTAMGVMLWLIALGGRGGQGALIAGLALGLSALIGPVWVSVGLIRLIRRWRGLNVGLMGLIQMIVALGTLIGLIPIIVEPTRMIRLSRLSMMIGLDFLVGQGEMNLLIELMAVIVGLFVLIGLCAVNSPRRLQHPTPARLPRLRHPRRRTPRPR